MSLALRTLHRWLGWSAFLLAVAGWPLALTAQSLIYQENFNTDGEKEGRYSTFGRGHSSTSAGPAYWEHSSLLGNVGTNNKALARRAGILWSHDIDPAEWTEDALAVFDATVAWTMSGKQNANIFITPNATSQSDDFIRLRLEDLGHTVTELGPDGPVPSKSEADLIIHSSSGGVTTPTQFNTSEVPLLTYNDGNHDDVAISTIGTVQTIQPTVDILDAAHPAAGGKSGAIQWTNSPVSLHTLGPVVAPKGKVVASYTVSTPAQLTTLAQVDDMISGKLGSIQTAGTIDAADLADQSSGRWLIDNPVPGQTGGDDYAVVSTGKLNAGKGGEFTFAISGDDGGRLRIDLNQDGLFTNADNIIVDDALHGTTDFYGDVTLPAGVFDFQWIGFERSGGAGWELSYAEGLGNRTLVDANGDWEALGDPDGFGVLSLDGPINVKTYQLDAPATTETRAAVFVVEAGEELLGGSITGFEGSGFWAGADMNEPTIAGGCCTTVEEARELTLKAVDVTGKEDVKITVALAATPLEFENTDYLRIAVDIDGDGPKDFQTIANFIGDTTTKSLTDGTTDLTPEFKDVSFDVPAGATNLVVRFQSQSTFYNEIVAFDNIRITSGIIPPVIPGDIDLNGKVDLTDFGILKANFGSGNEPSEGDIDGNGKVDLTDFGILKANFGKSGAAAVPEPATWLLAVLAAVALLVVRRRR